MKQPQLPPRRKYEVCRGHTIESRDVNVALRENQVHEGAPWDRRVRAHPPGRFLKCRHFGVVFASPAADLDGAETGGLGKGGHFLNGRDEYFRVHASRRPVR